MLSVMLFNVIMLSVVMLNVVAQSSPRPILLNFFGQISAQILEFTAVNYSKSSYIVSAPGV
jgi:hypothetical protein